jgi:hypothetical protein
MKNRTLWIVVGVISLLIIVTIILGVVYRREWLGFQPYRGWPMFAPHMMGHYWVWSITPLGFLWAILAWLIPIVLFALIILAIVGLIKGSTGTPATPAPVNAPPRATCPQCGRDIQPDWKLCPYCGANLKPSVM